MLRLKSEKQFLLGDQICDSVFNTLSLSGEAEIELVFATSDEIKDINARYRGVNSVTDVLSFPSLNEIREFTKTNYPFDYDDETNSVFLGSIMICMQRISEQAREIGHSEECETAYLFTHGVLHLLGYDHVDDNDKKEMRSVEELVLSYAGIKRNDFTENI